MTLSQCGDGSWDRGRGSSSAVSIAKTIGVTDVQEYARKRLHEKYRGKLILPDTVKKELTTLRLLWNWAVTQGHLAGPPPTRGIKLPRRAEKPPFMTRDEIQRIIDRGGLNLADQKSLWESMFLTIGPESVTDI